MKISVNGESEEISGKTLMNYIINKGLKPDAVIVEYNCKIIKKAQWEDTLLKENDNLEILSIVGGG